MGAVNLSKQTVNLSKGEKVNLSKSSEGLKDIMIGLRWASAEQQEKVTQEEVVVQPGIIGRLMGKKPKTIIKEHRERVGCGRDIDCDAWVALLKNGKFTGNDSDIAAYFNLNIGFNGKVAITHCGDNLVGGSTGDDEQILISLDNIPDRYNGMLIGVTIYMGEQRGQSFDTINDTGVRIVDRRDNFEICKFSDSEMSGKGAYTFLVGVLQRDKSGEWNFEAIGECNKSSNITLAAEAYSIKSN